MDASGSSQSNREYYNRFAAGYEKHRGINDPGGYHELLDELEAEFVQKHGRGGKILEVGCGTGLVLERLARFAGAATGIDVSEGMLEKPKRGASTCTKARPCNYRSRTGRSTSPVVLRYWLTFLKSLES